MQQSREVLRPHKKGGGAAWQYTAPEKLQEIHHEINHLLCTRYDSNIEYLGEQGKAILNEETRQRVLKAVQVVRYEDLAMHPIREAVKIYRKSVK